MRWARLTAVVVLAACSSGAAHTTTASSMTAIPTIVAPPSTDAELPGPETSTLQSTVDDYVAAQTTDFSVVAVDLATGERAEHLADRVVLSASLYKLFVARGSPRQLDDGEIRATDPMGDGEGRTVDACITAMIVVSDNACGEAGLSRVGYGALDASIHSAGYGSTSLATPQHTTADDVALFFERARAGTVVGDGHAAASASLYALLALQQVNDRLPTGLPPGTPIAHKTGDRYDWAHDAGVITTPKGDVLLAVLSGPWPYPCCDADKPGPGEAKAFGAIAGLGTAVYDYVAS